MRGPRLAPAASGGVPGGQARARRPTSPPGLDFPAGLWNTPLAAGYVAVRGRFL